MNCFFSCVFFFDQSRNFEFALELWKQKLEKKTIDSLNATPENLFEFLFDFDTKLIEKSAD